MKAELVAPCGMDCAVCSGYLALKYDLKGKARAIPTIHARCPHASGTARFLGKVEPLCRGGS